ncbi:hypothetical protein [Xanthomonas theicola]|uniref:hypothetical protein n=1 Tax=Xanthomonas theicola TaxID=56464 RepID=UPI001FEA025E|nr:hypothetical protein [Xanthomonas theicola]
MAGAHSDIGGSYLRGGLGVRSLNLMTDYHNGLLGEPWLPRLHAPADPRMNVIHRSEEGNALFRLAPRLDRASAAGQVRQLTADHARHAPPGVVSMPWRTRPNRLRRRCGNWLDRHAACSPPRPWPILR